MPGCRYVEEICLAAMLAAKWSAGVTPEVNLRGHVTHMPPIGMYKGSHCGFEIQNRHTRSPEQGPTKRTDILQKF